MRKEMKRRKRNENSMGKLKKCLTGCRFVIVEIF